MSHIANVDVKMTDLDALEMACKHLGLELVRGQQTYKWYGRSTGPLPEGFTAQELGKCSHAIRIPADQDPDGRAYEIGVVQRKDGQGFTLLWDFWMGGWGLQEKVGQNCTLLRQEYTAQRSIKQMRKQGMRVTRHVREDGRLELRCKR